VLMYDSDKAAIVEDCTVSPRSKESHPVNFAADISIYPNPAQDIIFLTETESVTKVEVLDIHHKMVLVPAYEQGIDISQLNQGVYFIKIYSASADPVTKKCIKIK
ncbi:MAG: T9SS type A sorting domain-containing protein, partial [Saprospiraceae bacterium]